MPPTRFKIEDIVHEDGRAAAEKFTCSICYCLPEEPTQTPCQHLFCADCIAPVLACPLCRVDLPEKKGIPLRECNRLLLNVLHDTKVWCPYRDDGTADAVPSPGSASGSSGSADAQQAGDPVPSSANGSKTIAASSSPTAARSFPRAASVEAVSGPSLKRQRVALSPPEGEGVEGVPAQQDRCTWSGTYGSLLSTHLLTCPWHFISCPHGCGEEVRRNNLVAHGRMCAKSFEHCPICSEAVRPGKMEEHRWEWDASSRKIFFLQGGIVLLEGLVCCFNLSFQSQHQKEFLHF